ncbi:MAG: acyltransferase family protein [Pyrinomonadaceae bacterium]
MAQNYVTTSKTHPLLSVSGSHRLLGLDALRGFAAIYVVLYHAVTQSPHDEWNAGLRWLAAGVRTFVHYGYISVFLFFVISGFCIHLHWAKARAAGRPAQLNFIPFWRRRLRRLYPPYLFALILFLAVAAYSDGIALTRFYLYDLMLHLTMLHNLNSHTAYGINGVFWTLAIEEQLYLAYFLLLFLRRRWGWRTTIAVCAAARAGWLLLSLLIKNRYGVFVPVNEAAAAHWFTWALGALSVEAAFGLVVLPRWCRSWRVCLAALAGAAGLAYLQENVQMAWYVHDSVWLLTHPLWAIGLFVLVNRVVTAELTGRLWRNVPRLWRWGASVGLFSYSLYLTHELVMLEIWRFTGRGLPGYVVAVLIMTPLSVACAWVFFWFCERPFLPRSARTAPAPTPLGPQTSEPVSA